MIRVLIADDHAVVRRGLRQIIEEQPDMRVVGEAQTAAEVITRAAGRDADVLVLDLQLPDRNGLDVLASVREAHPRLAVLLLSVHPEEQFAIPALKAGAVGYLGKEAAPEHLIQAVRRAHGGGRYVSPTLAEQLVASLGGADERPPHDALSAREFQILCLVAAGRTVSRIAADLGLSVKTVSTYRARLLEKLGLANNAELMHYALRHGFVL